MTVPPKKFWYRYRYLFSVPNLDGRVYRPGTINQTAFPIGNDDFDDIDDYDVKDDRIDGKDLASDRALLVSLSPVVLVNYSHPSLLSSFEGGL